MRIICLADTHGVHLDLDIPDGDVLVFAGDVTRDGTIGEVVYFNAWLGTMPHKRKIVVAGNHDFCFQSRQEECRRILTNADCLHDSSTIVDGVKFHGSPFQPWFHDFAFNLPRGPKLAEVWRRVPKNTDVLVTHCPPMGILDKTTLGNHEGCADLMARIRQLNIRLHVFGHIHERYGTVMNGGIQFVNASIADKGFKMVNNPITVTLDVSVVRPGKQPGRAGFKALNRLFPPIHKA